MEIIGKSDPEQDKKGHLMNNFLTQIDTHRLTQTVQLSLPQCEKEAEVRKTVTSAPCSYTRVVWRQ